jgi:hypothetical protein
MWAVVQCCSAARTLINLMKNYPTHQLIYWQTTLQYHTQSKKKKKKKKSDKSIQQRTDLPAPSGDNAKVQSRW